MASCVRVCMHVCPMHVRAPCSLVWCPAHPEIDIHTRARKHKQAVIPVHAGLGKHVCSVHLGQCARMALCVRCSQLSGALLNLKWTGTRTHTRTNRQACQCMQLDKHAAGQTLSYAHMACVCACAHVQWGGAGCSVQPCRARGGQRSAGTLHSCPSQVHTCMAEV